MSHRGMCVLSVLIVSGMLLLSGCGAPKLALQYQTGQTAQYEHNSQLIKDFKFEQPALNKATEEQTRTDLTVCYEQKIADVAADGSATATVTVKSIACKVTNKNEMRYEFDSRDEKFKTDTLNSLIGQSYTMTLMANGKAAVKDAAAIRAVAVTGEGQRIAQRLFAADESILERHRVALPEKGGESAWSVVLPSPPGMLAPKTFEKVYTLSDVKAENGKKVAVVSMKAKESMASVPGAESASSMGIMAKMFENDNDYTGAIEVDMTAGRLLDYHESLISTYIAQEQQKNAPDKGPDTLMMRLTNSFQTRLIQ